MIDFWKNTIWQQCGASIDMLENAIVACPDELWDQDSKFWYIAYHTLFFLDYHSAIDAANFHPPEPFTLSEMDPSGLMPDRTYTKAELLTYLQHGRSKCRKVTDQLTDESAQIFVANSYKKDYSIAEILLNTVRHVQHHTAQLNLLLRQNGYEAPGWVSRAKSN